MVVGQDVYERAGEGRGFDYVKTDRGQVGETKPCMTYENKRDWMKLVTCEQPKETAEKGPVKRKVVMPEGDKKKVQSWLEKDELVCACDEYVEG